MSRPSFFERWLMVCKPPEAGDTVRTLPPTAKGCHGILGAKPGRPIDLCRGCLRWQSRAAASDHLRLPNHIRLPNGAVWCQDRIGD